MLKILWKRGEIAPEEQFLLLSTIFCYLALDFYVKTRIRFSLRDKRLFEITEVEITRFDCIILCVYISNHDKITPNGDLIRNVLTAICFANRRSVTKRRSRSRALTFFLSVIRMNGCIFMRSNSDFSPPFRMGVNF